MRTLPLGSCSVVILKKFRVRILLFVFPVLWKGKILNNQSLINSNPHSLSASCSDPEPNLCCAVTGGRASGADVMFLHSPLRHFNALEFTIDSDKTTCFRFLYFSTQSEHEKGREVASDTFALPSVQSGV
jgi:hypothetical protein